MKTLRCLSITVFALIATSCVDEEYFGESDAADILSIELSEQNGTPVIDTQNDSIYVEVANGADISKLVVRKLQLSPFATTALAVGDTLDFSQDNNTIVIKAESGISSTWTISVFELGSQPQIENSDFNIWHSRGNYLDIGESDSASSWGTSNPGASFGGIESNVQRIEPEEGNFVAKLTTRYTFVGSLVGKPIAAGSMFTGDFMEGNISFDDPQASIDFGIPFTAEPSSFSIDYQYTPGPTNINASQEELSFPDTGDMYVLLERREDDTVKRVATAWFRIHEGNRNMKTINVDFIYGELPVGTPEYMLPQNDDTYAQEGETPTHIKAVFSSSAFGNVFQGAENSVLMIDNFVLNY